MPRSVKHPNDVASPTCRFGSGGADNANLPALSEQILGNMFGGRYISQSLAKLLRLKARDYLEYLCNTPTDIPMYVPDEAERMTRGYLHRLTRPRTQMPSPPPNLNNKWEIPEHILLHLIYPALREWKKREMTFPTLVNILLETHQVLRQQGNPDLLPLSVVSDTLVDAVEKHAFNGNFPNKEEFKTDLRRFLSTHRRGFRTLPALLGTLQVLTSSLSLAVKPLPARGQMASTSIEQVSVTQTAPTYPYPKTDNAMFLEEIPGPLNFLALNNPDDVEAIRQFFTKWGFISPDDGNENDEHVLAGLILGEAGIRPDGSQVVNSIGCVGMIQICPMGGKPGYRGSINLNAAKSYSLREYLDNALQVFLTETVGIKPGDLPADQFPIAIAATGYTFQSDPYTVVYPVGSAAYSQNPGWRPKDAQGKDIPGAPITVGSIKAYYRNKWWRHVESAQQANISQAHKLKIPSSAKREIEAAAAKIGVPAPWLIHALSVETKGTFTSIIPGSSGGFGYLQRPLSEYTELLGRAGKDVGQVPSADWLSTSQQLEVLETVLPILFRESRAPNNLGELLLAVREPLQYSNKIMNAGFNANQYAEDYRTASLLGFQTEAIMMIQPDGSQSEVASHSEATPSHPLLSNNGPRQLWSNALPPIGDEPQVLAENIAPVNAAPHRLWSNALPETDDIRRERPEELASSYAQADTPSGASADNPFYVTSDVPPELIPGPSMLFTNDEAVSSDTNATYLAQQALGEPTPEAPNTDSVLAEDLSEETLLPQPSGNQRAASIVPPPRNREQPAQPPSFTPESSSETPEVILASYTVQPPNQRAASIIPPPRVHLQPVSASAPQDPPPPQPPAAPVILSKEQLESMNTILFPVEGQTLNSAYRTSPFGWRDWDKKYHLGTDYGVPENTPLVASFPGTVVSANQDTTVPGGKHVIIESVMFGRTIRFKYLHMNELAVAAGDVVHAGQFVGLSGNTGPVSTGPHLHFSIEANRDGLSYPNDSVHYVVDSSKVHINPELFMKDPRSALNKPFDLVWALKHS